MHPTNNDVAGLRDPEGLVECSAVYTVEMGGRTSDAAVTTTERYTIYSIYHSSSSRALQYRLQIYCKCLFRATCTDLRVFFKRVQRVRFLDSIKLFIYSCLSTLYIYIFLSPRPPRLGVLGTSSTCCMYVWGCCQSHYTVSDCQPGGPKRFRAHAALAGYNIFIIILKCFAPLSTTIARWCGRWKLMPTAAEGH